VLVTVVANAAVIAKYLEANPTCYDTTKAPPNEFKKFQGTLAQLQKMDSSKMNDNIYSQLSLILKITNMLSSVIKEAQADSTQFVVRPDQLSAKLTGNLTALVACAQRLAPLVAAALVPKGGSASASPAAESATAPAAAPAAATSDSTTKSTAAAGPAIDAATIDALIVAKDAADFWKKSFDTKLEVPVKDLIEALTKTWPEPLDQKRLQKRVDPNGDGSVSIVEFNSFAQPLLAHVLKGCRAAAAAVLDREKDADYDVYWVMSTDDKVNNSNRKLLQEVRDSHGVRTRECASVADLADYLKDHEKVLADRFDISDPPVDSPRIVVGNQLFGLAAGSSTAEALDHNDTTVTRLIDQTQRMRWGPMLYPHLVYCGTYGRPNAQRVAEIWANRVAIRVTTSANEARAFLCRTSHDWNR